MCRLATQTAVTSEYPGNLPLGPDGTPALTGKKVVRIFAEFKGKGGGGDAPENMSPFMSLSATGLEKSLR